MGGMSDVVIEHEELVGEALSQGLTTKDEIIAYMVGRLTYVDQNYVAELLKTLHEGERDE
jgi:hypothetical protein|tara:strand:+ start:183 stop:362 length:180 start_codon:yes stop_codon:yes gene_type:complete